ncbi:hypothetical protein M3484_16315 [Pseudomonas sp. GX19020]|uniref:hypothetical protein n=1 Tax=Pseudomonas sp. GX19020 TaxID=2942277 RepID=UPI002019CEDB|nr:hypothetical protein [Pseudomonas sp. GX19020]MCL4068136.1 hypothetical protein [Pseudomonas sp. GX19020]
MISRDALKRPGQTAQVEGTWAERARATINAVDQGLPPDATLQQRILAVDAAYPFIRRAHYPYQVWCRVRRNYLSKFGYVPQNAARGPLLRIMEGKSR